MVHFYNLIFSQSDTTITDTTTSSYRNLVEKKFYRLSYSSQTRDGTTIYKINEKEVDKATYDKYNTTWANMETCKPCILLSYDYNDNLLYKGIQYTDCRVGFWIEYFSNGKVKIIGHYKENKKENWENAYSQGLCRKDGVWTYFNENGDKLYWESWEDGKLVKKNFEK